MAPGGVPVSGTMDPRLNSVHLEAPRRQDYRRAREALLHARGCQTLYAEREADEPDDSPSNTLIQKADHPDPSALLVLAEPTISTSIR